MNMLKTALMQPGQSSCQEKPPDKKGDPANGRDHAKGLDPGQNQQIKAAGKKNDTCQKTDYCETYPPQRGGITM